MFKIKPTAVKNYDLNFKLTDKPNSINFDIKTEVQGEAIKINNAQKSQFPRSQNHQDTTQQTFDSTNKINKINGKCQNFKENQFIIKYRILKG